MILGKGTYGEVSRKNNKAVKKFKSLNHLIQEYAALKYLSDCSKIVKCVGVSFENLELHMELYDLSLRGWLQKYKGRLEEKKVMVIIHDVLLGLVQLQERGFAHGDIKPSNILVRESPLGAVLGDCGFVSVAKYSKVERTAAPYRDPVIVRDINHDMFSLGICFLELLGNVRLGEQHSYEALKVLTKQVPRQDHAEIIRNLLHEDRSRRPPAQVVMQYLFSKASIHNESIGYREINIEEKPTGKIRSTMKRICAQMRINRGRRGYTALMYYIQKNKIEISKHNIHAVAVLMILSSVFGEKSCKQKEISMLMRVPHEDIHPIIGSMLSDDNFLHCLMRA